MKVLLYLLVFLTKFLHLLVEPFKIFLLVHIIVTLMLFKLLHGGLVTMLTPFFKGCLYQGFLVNNPQYFSHKPYVVAVVEDDELLVHVQYGLATT